MRRSAFKSFKTMQTLEPHSGSKRRHDGSAVPALPNPPHLNAALMAAQATYRTRKVFIGGIGKDATEESLIRFFSHFGEVENCEVIMDKETQRPRGFGFVTFADQTAADYVVQLHKFNFQNKEIETKVALPREVLHAIESNKHTLPVMPLVAPQTIATVAGTSSSQLLPAGASTPANSVPGGHTSVTNSLALTMNILQHQQQLQQQQQQRVQQHSQGRFPAAISLMPPALPSQLMTSFPSYNYVLNSNGSLQVHPDLSQLFQYTQASTMPSVDYAQVLGASIPSTPSGLPAFPPRLHQGFLAPLGMHVMQQALNSASVARPFDPTSLGLMNSVDLNAFIESYVRQQQAQTVAVADAAVRAPGSQNANAATIPATLSVPPPNGVCLQKPPRLITEADGPSEQPSTPAAAVGLISSGSSSTSQTNAAGAEATTSSSVAPAKIPRANHCFVIGHAFTSTYGCAHPTSSVYYPSPSYTPTLLSGSKQR